jgi:Domain of unknown function (DUF6946)
VRAIVRTSLGVLSLTVEAKAREPFGDKTLKQWLKSGKSEEARRNRECRWAYISENLPLGGAYGKVRYQLLHRCAAAVIEAKRMNFQHAAFVVQAFNEDDANFDEYAAFCRAMNMPAVRDRMVPVTVDNISLAIGWAECAFSADEVVAATA